MKLFTATRSKRKFNNPVSFDERHIEWMWQLGSERIGDPYTGLSRAVEVERILGVARDPTRGVPNKPLTPEGLRRAR
jgi:hypothetical protein